MGQLENQVLSEYDHCILIAVVEDGTHVLEYVMSNQETGSTHTLIGNDEDTPRERVLAHWRGFCNNHDYLPNTRVVQFENKKPFMPYFNTLAELSEAVVLIRDTANIRSQHGAIRSRGIDILFMSKGERLDGDDYYGWGGTRSELMDAVTSEIKSNPRVDEVWISGGYDGADSLFAMNNGDYEPNVHVWDILLWDAKSDFAPFDFLRL